jgi:hypothetical protein
MRRKGIDNANTRHALFMTAGAAAAAVAMRDEKKHHRKKTFFFSPHARRVRVSVRVWSVSFSCCRPRLDSPKSLAQLELTRFAHDWTKECYFERHTTRPVGYQPLRYVLEN